MDTKQSLTAAAYAPDLDRSIEAVREASRRQAAALEAKRARRLFVTSDAGREEAQRRRSRMQ